VRKQLDTGALATGVARVGCLKRGASRVFALHSSANRPTYTSLGMATVTPTFLAHSDNHVAAMVIRHSSPPTQLVYDARVAYPDLRASLSACDVAARGSWYIQLDVSPASALEEVFFSLSATLEDSSTRLGETVSGFACCGQYKYYSIPQLDGSAAPFVNLNVTDGVMKTLYLKHGACPVEALDVNGEVCTGWCVLTWFRKFSTNLGRANFLYEATLSVPYGAGEQPDKRRAGRWYIGIQALEGPVEYVFTTGAFTPLPQRPSDGCSRLDRYCSSKFEDQYVLESGARPRLSRGRLILACACTLLGVLAASRRAACTVFSL